ncbi:MAG: hypothetical protein ACF8LL_06150 [Phycisphaerales bacterium]
MNQIKLNRKSLLWLLPLLLTLLYPPLQSQAYVGSDSGWGTTSGVGGRDFDGWGPFWHIFDIDFGDISDAMDAGDFIEGDHAVEWGVLIWEWLAILVIAMICQAIRTKPAPTP